MFDNRLTDLAESAASRLRERQETIAVAESSCGATRHLLTGSGDRSANMVAFAAAALELLNECLD